MEPILTGCPYECLVCPFGLSDAQKSQTKIRKEFARIKKHTTILQRLQPPDKQTIIFPYGHTYYPNYAIDRALNALINDGRTVIVYTLGNQNIVKTLVDNFGQKIKIGIAFSCLNDKIREHWEPNTPSIPERFEAIKYALSHNIPVVVWVRHYLDSDLDKLITKLLELGVQDIVLTRHNIQIGNSEAFKRAQEINSDKAWYQRLAMLHRKGLLDKVKLGQSFAGLKEKLLRREVELQKNDEEKKKRRRRFRIFRRHK